MGLEPTTATLATWRSTTELHPRQGWREFLLILLPTNYKVGFADCKVEFLPSPPSPASSGDKLSEPAAQKRECPSPRAAGSERASFVLALGPFGQDLGLLPVCPGSTNDERLPEAGHWDLRLAADSESALSELVQRSPHLVRDFRSVGPNHDRSPTLFRWAIVCGRATARSNSYITDRAKSVPALPRNCPLLRNDAGRLCYVLPSCYGMTPDGAGLLRNYSSVLRLRCNGAATTGFATQSPLAIQHVET